MNTMLTHPSMQKEYILNALDRCDRCGAQAYVKVIGQNGDLMFCGHHYNKAMDNAIGYENMMKFAVEIIDERDRLEENRTQGESY